MSVFPTGGNHRAHPLLALQVDSTFCVHWGSRVIPAKSLKPVECAGCDISTRGNAVIADEEEVFTDDERGGYLGHVFVDPPHDVRVGHVSRTRGPDRQQFGRARIPGADEDYSLREYSRGTIDHLLG